MHTVIRCLSLVLLVFAAADPIHAQSDTASLSGIVTDPSGAVIASAKVRLLNEATLAVREGETSTAGRFSFTLLPPGLYELTIEVAGFKTYRDSRVQLQVAQPSQLSAQLELGDATQSVEVEGVISALNTESAAVGTLVDSAKILALPLNGRQFAQLALLVPGANAGGRTVQQNTVRLGQTGGVSVAGGRTNNTAFLLDGANDNDPDYNSLSYAPPLDAVSEFQVQTAGYSAEFGRASGGQINVVTKSGGRQVHGSAWEFVRNDNLDARPFNLTTGDKPKYQRNQFGATIGGPLIPQRLFGFFAWESLRLRQAGAGLTSVTVPSLLERNGDFSASGISIYDPTTLSGGVRTQFAGNRIQPDRINPLARAALAALPEPNVAGTNTFVNATGVLRQNVENYSGRIDVTLNSRSSLFGRYSIAEEDAVIPDTVPKRDNVSDARPQNLALGFTTIVSSNVVNETRASFNRVRLISGLPELTFDVNGQQVTLPRFIATGYPVSGGAGGFTGTTGGGVVNVRNNTFQLYDNVSWQIGSHSLKFGGEIMGVQYNRYEAPNVIGTYQFTNGFTTRTARNDGTGHALASFLLGIPQQGSRSVGPSVIRGRQPSYAAYVQGKFRASDRLTLDWGLRYELAPPMYDAGGQMSSIDYSRVPAPGAIFLEGRTGFYSPTLFVCGQSGYPKGCAYTDRNNFAPRLGVAWQPAARTAVRASGGIFYAGNDANPLFRLAAGLPANIAQTLTSDSFVPQFQNLNIFGPAIVGPVQIQAAGIDLYQRTSYTIQWNLNVQRELGRDFVAEVGYLATLGLKLEQNVQPNNAQPGAGAVDPRRPYASLIFAPGTTFPSNITVQGNSVPVGFINYLPHSAQSNYHALLARLERRFAGGFSLLAAYTFSKAITNAPQFRNAGGVNGAENSPAQDAFNLRNERGLASFHTKNRFVNTVLYDLPFRSGTVSKIFGGVQLSGILTLQSGFPFTVNLRGDTAGAGAGTGGIFVRPNAVPGASWELPRGQRSGARFFNTAAFVQPAAGTFGNVGRNTVIGPGFVNLDFSLAKKITLTERLSLDLRSEFFNLFNHPIYNQVGRIINDATFGQVLNQLDPRQIQFGAKIIF